MKIKFSPLILTMLFSLLSLDISAAQVYDFKVDGIYYKIQYGQQKVVYVSPTSYSDNTERYTSGHTGDVVIPENVTYNGETYPVTGINSYAFVNSSVTSVIIPTSVTFIGVSAFNNCRQLTEIIIPKSVTTIRSNAFDYCSALTTVTNLATIPQSIDANTFSNYGTLYVEPSSVEAYRNDNYWKNFTIKAIEPSANISIGDASLTRGTAKSIDVNLSNMEIDIVGFQFDLTLPEGITLATSSTGSVNITATNRLGSKYTLRGKPQGNNVYRFAYLSTSGNGISDNSGSIFSISLTASETTACGNIEATISNVTVTGKDGTEISPEDNSFNLTLPHAAINNAAKDATCTEPGNKNYWYCSICDKYFTDSTCKNETNLEAITIPIINHAYGDVIWTWTGLTTATAKMTCTHDDTHILTTDATITNAVTTPATDTEEGIRTYTAKATLNGVEYTDTKTETIDALGHDLSTIDNGDGTHTTSCSRCDYSIVEEHTYVDGKCNTCGSIEVVDNDTDITQFDNIVYINKSEAFVGTQTTLSVQLNNTESVYGYEFKLYLPDGVTVSTYTDSFGDTYPDVTLTETRTNSKRHTLSASINSDNVLTVLCYSDKKYAFINNNGEVAQIKINIPAEMAQGDYPIEIKSEAISLNASTPIIERIKSTLTIMEGKQGDANGDDIINVGDITSIAGYILGEDADNFNEKAADANADGHVNVGDITTVAGMILDGTVSIAKSIKYNTYRSDINMIERLKSIQYKANTKNTQYDNFVYIDDIYASSGSEMILSVKMKNTEPVYGYQFNLQLPEGVSFVTSTDAFGDTEIDAYQTEVRTNSNRHIFNTSLKDNILTVLCYSQTKKAFIGNEGEVATIKIKLSEDITDGIYPIIIKDEAISLEESTPIINTIQSSLTVSNHRIGDVNGDNLITISDIATFINYLNGKVPSVFIESAADVNNDKCIDVKDIQALCNLLLKK